MPLLQNIREGKYDTSLDRIIKECQDRKERRIYSLRVGDMVRFPSSTRPAYLANQTARIVEWRRTRVLVELTSGPNGRFRSGRIIAHASSLVPVEGGESSGK